MLLNCPSIKLLWCYNLGQFLFKKTDGRSFFGENQTPYPVVSRNFVNDNPNMFYFAKTIDTTSESREFGLFLVQEIDEKNFL